MNHENLSLTFTAQGLIGYFDHYPNDQKNVRMVLEIYLADQPKPIHTIVDSGAPWCVLDPQEFQKVANWAEPPHPLAGKLNIRGLSYAGWLYRIPLRLDASVGTPLEIEGTFFVPDLPEGESWFYPNFLGLQGFLNRIRWAVDPDYNLFLFGPLY